MSEVSSAIRQIASEKGLTYEAVLSTIEAALAAAYRKDFGSKLQNIKVDYDPDTGKLKVYDVKTVVEDLPEDLQDEDVPGEIPPPDEQKKDRDGASPAAEGEEAEEVRKFNPKLEIELKDALLLKPDAVIGDELRMQLEVPGDFGRMAAQTAKQVIIQKLREAERDMVFGEYKDKEGEVVSGVVQRREGRLVLVDLGKAVGVLPPEEQVPSERYIPGARLKYFVKSVSQTSKGPEILLSRISDEILKKVFYLEIPEISNSLIEIKSIAREAGSRSKVAVMTEYDNVDPIGSCVGQRGARIQTIIGELGGEKVDIIEYDPEPSKFIANALSPAKVHGIEIQDEGRKAVVKVGEDQFSLAIGKNGQNVRLAARLTGWKIDIIEDKQGGEVISSEVFDEDATEKRDGTTEEAPVEGAGDTQPPEAEGSGGAEEAPVEEEKPKKRGRKKKEA